MMAQKRITTIAGPSNVKKLKGSCIITLMLQLGWDSYGLLLLLILTVYPYHLYTGFGHA